LSTFSDQIAKLIAISSRREHQLSTDGSVERMLRVAFETFAQREQCLQLRFCDNEFDAIGTRGILYDKALRENLVWLLDWKTIFEQTIRAVTSQNCKITRLEIDERSRDDSVNESGLCTDDIEQEISRLCSQLAYLDINSWNDDVETTMKSTKRMVSAARNLRFLDLVGFGQWVYPIRDCLQQILGCVASTSLQTISIHEFQMSEQELLGFLGRQRGTLQELCLSEGCLLTGSCISLVAWIRDNLPDLVDLELSDICQSRSQRTCVDNEHKSYFIRRGEDMRAGLTNILDRKCERKVKKEDNGGSEQVEEDDV
jgi:hypothetical protein